MTLLQHHSVFAMILQIEVAAALLLLLMGSVEAGFRWGRRTATAAGEAGGGTQLGAVQGATLGLLGLLLGFSFAGAATRFIERQDLITQEANTIGTAYLRADMLDEPHRSALRRAIEEYVRHRIVVSRGLRYGLPPEAAAEISRFHERIWKAASEGVAAKPAMAVVVLGPVNEVIDLHATRVATAHKHLPALVLGLLVACSAIAIGAIGYGCGLARRRALLMTSSLALLIAAALYTTIDLDYPRVGLIRVSDAPLVELEKGFSR